MVRQRIYWAGAVLNAALGLAYVGKLLIVGPTPLAPLWIGCTATAAVIFAVLAVRTRPRHAPRRDTGIVLSGPPGWRHTAR